MKPIRFAPQADAIARKTPGNEGFAHRAFAVLSLFLLAAAESAEAQTLAGQNEVYKEVEFARARQVRFELMIVRTPEAAAVPLLPDLRNPDKIKVAQEKLLALISKKEAELVDWPIVTTRSGNRCVIENVHEFRYPVDFTQPQIEINAPNSTVTSMPTPTAPPESSGTSGKPPKVETKVRVPPPRAIVGGVPEIFDTKNVGVTMGVEPSIGQDGRTIDISMESSHVTFRRWNKSTTELLGPGLNHKVVVEQPEFQYVRTVTSLSVASGQPLLFNVSKLQEPAGQVELFILTATIVDESGREVNVAANRPEKKNGAQSAEENREKH